MDNSNYDIFWTEAISQLIAEGKLTETEHDMWFSQLSFLHANNYTFVLQVPSKFIRDQIKDRYLGILIKKLHLLSGIAFSIDFHIEPPSAINLEIQSRKKRNQKARRSNLEDLIDTHPVDEGERPLHKQLRPEYTFSNFIIGKSNDFAAAASQAISQNPGIKYNPFVIYGGVGLGKTHLMQAIGHHIHTHFTNKKIVFITSEEFMNEFILSIQTNSQNQFKNKYRKTDVLLIDDIHDLHDKKAQSTQEELFHTFNALYDAKKQLVFTCDRPPAELKNFNDRLKSRFELGLNVDITPPNYETRCAIIRKKLEISSKTLPEDIIEFIAANITTNIRELEASLSNVLGFIEITRKEINIDMTKKLLKSSIANIVPTNVSINKIQKEVAEYFGITTADLKSKNRKKHIVYSRQISMFLIRELTNFSTTEIGQEFGGRDHTTVMHSCQKIENMMKADPLMEPMIINLTQNIKNRKTE